MNVFKALAPALVFLLLLAITAWVYWPGHTGPSLLDDKSSLRNLEQLAEQPDFATDFVFGDRSGTLGRSVSMGTFVLEKRYLDGGIADSKKINIMIHLLNGFLVAWLFAILLRFRAIEGHRWVAVLAASAWLLSPLYVSTVLYAVQRMAMMAALFSLAGCISYAHWRLSMREGHVGWFGLLPVIGFVALGVLAKENAVVVLPIILLMEVLWFEGRTVNGCALPWLRRIAVSLIIIGGLGVLVFLWARYDWLVGQYGSREFTLHERLLTQVRVLWDYVGQIYLPEVDRMGLYHDDFLVSSSLTEPPATLNALLGWIAVAAACLALSTQKWGRGLVFALLFFLAGHSIESTVFSLEIYFEHRNYLPGVGLFLAVAVIFSYLASKWPELQSPLLAWMGVYLLWLAAQTSSQVQIWSSAPLLAIQHVNAHPGSARANADMAVQLAFGGALDDALVYSARAHKASLGHRASASERVGDWTVRDLALSCMARQPLPRDRINGIDEVYPERPLGSVHNFHVLVRLLQADVCPEFDWQLLADRLASIYLVKGPPSKASANMYSLMAGMENALERYDYAYEYTQRFLTLSPDNIRGLLMQLHFTTALGRDREVEKLKARLLSMEREGRLTIKERHTLSLYVEM